jgi:hypothetical protein
MIMAPGTNESPSEEGHGTIRLRRDDRGRLMWRAAPDAEEAENVRVARCFPWSHRDGYISIRDKDGKELHLLPTLDHAPEKTRALIEEELRAQEFAPQITVVEEIDDRFDVMTWKVQTESGPVELQVKHSEDIRQLDDGRVLIRDHAGGVFQISNVTAMDAESRNLIEENLA